MTTCNVKKVIAEYRAPALIGTISLLVTVSTIGVLARGASTIPGERSSGATVTRYATAQLLSSLASLDEGALVETAGFYVPGDGGEALYCIRNLSDELQPNGADVISLKNGRVAVLLESKAVNYRMFGAVGDGESDDGVQIKLAHELAGMIRLAEKDYDKALEELKQANQKNPYNLYRMAIACQGKGDMEKAKSLCKKAANFNGLPSMNYAFIRTKAQQMMEAE